MDLERLIKMLKAENYFLNLIQKDLCDTNVMFDRNDAYPLCYTGKYDLLDLEHKIKKAVQMNGVFIYSDNTLYLNIGYWIKPSDDYDHIHLDDIIKDFGLIYSDAHRYKTRFPLLELEFNENGLLEKPVMELFDSMTPRVDKNKLDEYEDLTTVETLDYISSLDIDRIYDFLKSMNCQFLYFGTFLFNLLHISSTLYSLSIAITKDLSNITISGMNCKITLHYNDEDNSVTVLIVTCDGELSKPGKYISDKYYLTNNIYQQYYYAYRIMRSL